MIKTIKTIMTTIIMIIITIILIIKITDIKSCTTILPAYQEPIRALQKSWIRMVNPIAMLYRHMKQCFAWFIILRKLTLQFWINTIHIYQYCFTDSRPSSWFPGSCLFPRGQLRRKVHKLPKGYWTAESGSWEKIVQNWWRVD